MAKHFPMYDIRAHGDMPLPADLPNGTYYLYAYTDRMISFKPGDVFVQQSPSIKSVALGWKWRHRCRRQTREARR